MCSRDDLFVAPLSMKRWLPISTAIVALAAIVAFALIGVTIDISRWRDDLAERASAAMGRPLRLDGALRLTLRRDAMLHTDGVRILNPPGFATPEFATLDAVRVRFDLLDAMRGRLHVHGIEASGGRLDLERAADGRANWIWPTAAARDRRPVGIGEVSLRDLAIGYQDGRAARRLRFDVDELAGSIELDDPTTLALRGRTADESRFVLKVTGGPARLLQEANAQWPFALDFNFLEARLKATGAIDVSKQEARFDFDAVADDLSQIARVLDARLKGIGSVALRGKIAATRDAIEVSELHGRMGKSDLTGHFAVALQAARPRVSGALDLATLDLDPFLRVDAGEADGRLEQVSLRNLVPIDIDVGVSVRELHALPVDLRDATVEVHADAERVRAPIRATVAGVPFSGRFDLDTAAKVPALAVQLDAKDAAVGDLASVVSGPTNLDGTLGRFGLRLAGRGETIEALARDLEIGLTVEAARLRYGAAGGRAIPFTLDALDLSLRPGERLRGSARGSLAAKRAILSFRGGTLPDMLRAGAMPLTADVAIARATLRLEGTIAHANAAQGSDVAFQLKMPRIGELAPWIAVAPDAKLPLAVHGRVRTGVDAWRLDATTVKLGRSAATIDIAHSTGAMRPFTNIAVSAALIDVPQLAMLGRAGDASVLPARIDLSDADIRFEGNLVALHRIDLLDVKLAARVRDGRLAPSPIAARLAGTPLDGTVAFDPTGEVPQATLDLSASVVEVGALLRALKVAEPVQGRADALQVAVRAQGRTLHELLQRSSFTARLTGGNVTVRGARNKPVAQIVLQQAVVDVPAGGRLRADIEGTLDDTPVTVEVVSGTLADFLSDANRVPFALNARGAETQVSLTGTVLLPLGRGGELELEMGGERLDTLNSLARVELPRWGPWSLRGPIEINATGYEVRGLVLSVGENRFMGTGRLDVTGARPRLDVRVTAPSIQLDDFPLPERLADEPPAALTPEGIRATTRELSRKTERLMSAGFLRRLDAHVDVKCGKCCQGLIAWSTGCCVSGLPTGVSTWVPRT